MVSTYVASINLSVRVTAISHMHAPEHVQRNTCKPRKYIVWFYYIGRLHATAPKKLTLDYY